MEIVLLEICVLYRCYYDNAITKYIYELSYPALPGGTLTCQVCKQNIDGTYGDYETVKTQTVDSGGSCSYTWSEDGYEDVTFSVANMTADKIIRKRANKSTLQTINERYLKDTNGNVISPIISTASIYDSNHQNLDTILENLEDDWTVLYENESSPSHTATLNDNVSNYSYIEILYKDGDNEYNSVKIKNPLNKKVMLMTHHIGGDNAAYIKKGNATIGDTTITVTNGISYYFAGGSWYNGGFYNVHFITNVIGYK